MEITDTLMLLTMIKPQSKICRSVNGLKKKRPKKQMIQQDSEMWCEPSAI